jgi:hypothetical protein
LKKQTPESQIAEYALCIKKELEHWNHLYHIGGQDPFWHDGTGMNLTRNHIISYKMDIQKLCEEYALPVPPEANLPTPREVETNYMAQADLIRTKAEETLQVYLNDSSYKSLMKLQDILSPKQANDCSINGVLGYVEGLQQAIAQDDLITMRRHRDPDRYLHSFKECLEAAKKIKETPVPPGTQLSLLDCMQCCTCIDEEAEEEIEEDEMSMGL